MDRDEDVPLYLALLSRLSGQTEHGRALERSLSAVCAGLQEVSLLTLVCDDEDLVVQSTHHRDVTLLHWERCNYLTRLVAEDSVGAEVVAGHSAESATKFRHDEGAFRCHVNLVAVPEELLRGHADVEAPPALGPRVLRELVDAGDELGLEEKESVVRADADLVRLGHIAIVRATPVHLLIEAEVGDLLLLVEGLDWGQVVLLENGQLLVGEEDEVVKAWQILDYVHSRIAAGLDRVVLYVDIIFYL